MSDFDTKYKLWEDADRFGTDLTKMIEDLHASWKTYAGIVRHLVNHNMVTKEGIEHIKSVLMENEDV
jgi:hypothetical protein